MKNAALIALLCLSGCAIGGFGPDQVAVLNQAIRDGRCSDAYAIASQTNDPVKYFNGYVIAKQCEGDETKALNYLNYGAQMGNRNSIDQLLSLGLPVPRRQVAQNGGDDALLNAMILNSFRPQQPFQLPAPPPIQQPRSVNCTSNVYGNTVNTNCR